MFGIFFKKCGFLLLILHYLFFYDHFLEVDSKIFLASKYLVKNISAHLRAESLILWGESKYGKNDKKAHLIALSCVPTNKQKEYHPSKIEMYTWMTASGTSIVTGYNYVLNENTGTLLIKQPPSSIILKCTIRTKSHTTVTFVHYILQYEHPRFDVRVSVGLIFHHRCDIEYLNDYLSYFKPKFYGLIRKYGQRITHKYGRVVKGESRDFNEAIRTIDYLKTIQEFEHENENSWTEMRCKLQLIYDVVSEDRAHRIISSYAKKLSCSNFKCEMALYENLFFLPKFRAEMETKEGMEEFRQNFSTLPVSINVSMPEAQVHATCNVGSQFTMGMFCLPCAPGTYQTVAPNIFEPEEHKCLPCQGHTYQPEFGQTECLKCLPTLKVNSKKTTCSSDEVKFVGRRLEKEEMTEVMEESVETYYDLGTIPEDEDVLTSIMVERSASLVFVVVANCIFFVLLVVSVAIYAIWKKKQMREKREKRMSLDEFKHINEAVKNKFAKDDAKKEEINMINNKEDEGEDSTINTNESNKNNLFSFGQKKERKKRFRKFLHSNKMTFRWNDYDVGYEARSWSNRMMHFSISDYLFKMGKDRLKALKEKRKNDLLIRQKTVAVMDEVLST